MYSKKQTPKQDYFDLLKIYNQFSGTYEELKEKLCGLNGEENQFDFNFRSLYGTIYRRNDGNTHAPYFLGDTFKIYDEDGQLLGTFSVDDIMEEKYVDTIRIGDIVWETDGEDVDLPTTFDIPSNLTIFEIADYLSDKFGYLVESWVFK